jgi:putative phosphoribosyl transferase
MFKNRAEAGKLLTARLKDELEKEAIVLGIPRGGIIVGREIAQSLSLPLDCLVIKKIPAPQSEVTVGAVGEDGVVVWDEALCRRLEVSVDYQQEIVKSKLAEFERKEGDFRQGRPAPEVAGKVVVLVDDGIATGATIKAAIKVLRSFHPKELIVAVPVISLDELPEMKQAADRLIYLESPEMFFSVDQFYEDFKQPTDEEIRNILASSANN